ncbi:hypothetical protein B0T22DRAFT_444554 [Podospora appendiculata]|uniref:Uncharacterized protein n=1 Tax=Podospora appendiculata TaxID=314037 RepID=A0AAE0X0T1_9PEZI|nr:hypothetical protein B0T22DRAFT_444554 [Podospora appendiculata]
MPAPWWTRRLGPGVGKVRIVHSVPILVGEWKLTDWIATIRINLSHSNLMHHILQDPKPAQLCNPRYQRAHISVYCMIRNSIQPMIPVLKHAGYDVDGGELGFEPKQLWDAILAVVPGSTNRMERMKFDLITELMHAKLDDFPSLLAYFHRVNNIQHHLTSFGMSPPDKFIQTMVINGIASSERRVIDTQLLERMKAMSYVAFHDALKQFIYM